MINKLIDKLIDKLLEYYLSTPKDSNEHTSDSLTINKSIVLQIERIMCVLSLHIKISPVAYSSSISVLLLYYISYNLIVCFCRYYGKM